MEECSVWRDMCCFGLPHYFTSTFVLIVVKKNWAETNKKLSQANQATHLVNWHAKKKLLINLNSKHLFLHAVKGEQNVLQLAPGAFAEKAHQERTKLILINDLSCGAVE